MDELRDLLTPALYQRNPFRILGETVTASTREINRRESVRGKKAKLGLPVEDTVAGLLAPSSPPTQEQRKAALKRLHTPRDRFLAELFWFWPAPDTSDTALRALQENDLATATERWEAD